MIAGVVLAGGRSTRMGCDKAVIEVAPGERLVDRVVAAVRDALAAAGEGAPRVLVAGSIAGHECAPDVSPGLGPVAGIEAGFCRLRSAAPGTAPREPAAMLVVPVDLPALRPEALLPLLAVAAPAAYAGWSLPVLLALDDATGTAIRATLAATGRGRSVRALMGRVGAREVPLDARHARSLSGANTPAELAATLGARPVPGHRGGGEA